MWLLKPCARKMTPADLARANPDRKHGLGLSAPSAAPAWSGCSIIYFTGVRNGSSPGKVAKARIAKISPTAAVLAFAATVSTRDRQEGSATQDLSGRPETPGHHAAQSDLVHRHQLHLHAPGIRHDLGPCGGSCLAAQVDGNALLRRDPDDPLGEVGIGCLRDGADHWLVRSRDFTDRQPAPPRMTKRQAAAGMQIHIG